MRQSASTRLLDVLRSATRAQRRRQQNRANFEDDLSREYREIATMSGSPR